jgi:thymidine phosphorylase
VDEPGGLRGKALAAWRKGQAVELALEGHCYDTIAERVGYTNRGTAWRVVQEALEERKADNVDYYRQVAVARLERLIQAHWEGAVSGQDTRSADVVLKTVAAQSKLLGLEAKPGDVVEQSRTVVIGGTSEEYIAALRRVSGRTE